MVGATLGTKLVQQKQEVMMGLRTANSEGAHQWLKSVGGNGQIGTFAQAAAFGEIIFDCTNGANALGALHLAGAENLGRKILIQTGNPSISPKACRLHSRSAIPIRSANRRNVNFRIRAWSKHLIRSTARS